jgi:AAT family amino acid transporter
MAAIDPEKVAYNHDGSPASVDRNHEHAVNEDRLRRSLSARQVQMIAIGGTIGTGLFLGTGKALATGGPGSLLLCYAIVGGIVFTTMLSLGEMAAFVPVAGSFCTFAGRYVRWYPRHHVPGHIGGALLIFLLKYRWTMRSASR